MPNEPPRSLRRRPPPLIIASYVSVVAGALFLVCLLALLLFPDPLANSLLKPRIAAAFAEAYPASTIHIADMHYSLWANSVGCDSVALSAVDGSFSGTVGPSSVSGIGWLHLLLGRRLAPDDLADVVVAARDIDLRLPKSQYDIHFGQLRLSVADSEIVVEGLQLHPSGDDKQFFAESKFRRTRFRASVPYARVAGLACFDLLQAKIYRCRSARLQDLFLDVLIDKDKSSARDTSPPPMPGEMLSSIDGALRIDSVMIRNGSLRYAERFVVGAKPALITLDSMDVLALGIDNQRDTAAAMIVHAEGTFMKAGSMRVLMKIPDVSADVSMQYSGSLSKMDLRALNPFLEPAEQQRITAGVLQSSTFAINVSSGHASGIVHANYRGLVLAAINKKTGSEKGFADGMASFIANTFKIHGTNEPDKSGESKTGTVKYVRQNGDPFFRFVWFALRSGVGDLVGF